MHHLHIGDAPVVIQAKSQDHLAAAVPGELPAVQQIVPALRHRLDEGGIIRAKGRSLHIQRRHQRFAPDAAVLLHFHAGQPVLLGERLLERARARRFRRWGVRRVAERQITGVLLARGQFLPRRLHGGLQFGKIRPRDVLGFRNLDLGPFQFRCARVAVCIRICGARILAGIIFGILRRLGRRLRGVHIYKLQFRRLKRRGRRFEFGEEHQRWQMKFLPEIDFLAGFVTAPGQQMHQERQGKDPGEPS